MSSSNHCGVSVISRFSGGVSVVANSPTVNADVSIKIILKKIFTFLKMTHQQFNLKKKKPHQIKIILKFLT